MTVDSQKFLALVNTISCGSIMETGCAEALHRIEGRLYVAISGISSHLTGWEVVGVHEVVAEAQYNGELKPLPYGRHWQEVTVGNRPRSYTGMRVFFKKNAYVFVGEGLEVFATAKGTQLQLFNL